MLGEMVKTWVGQGFIFHAVILEHYTFSEKFIIWVKEPPHFNILQSRLRYNKSETKSGKGANMVGFIKTYDQYAQSFGHLLSSLIVRLLVPFLLAGNK